jgi:hypothetical protein
VPDHQTELVIIVSLQNAMMDFPEELRTQNWTSLLRHLDQEIYILHCDLDIPQSLSEGGKPSLPKGFNLIK